ncbi:MAG: SusC/RagA family TonB-linked outer membrane protein, partial [Bacteroidales bacterium]|nr:SusC/RagA family TonB-linked outer membrane protein [Bacteroidales bacterium]
KYILTALNADTGTDYLNYVPGSKQVSSSIYLETALSYDRTFAEKHTVSGMLVWTARESLTANESTLQNSLPSRNLGLAGRFTYGLLDRYYIEANFGYNGSERFDRNNRWGFFPSGGLGWVVSKESFWESSPLANVIQLFKLKASYGIVGNDAISNERFFYLSEVNMNNSGKGFTFGTDFGRTLNGISISRYSDRKIGWEISHKLNLGVEMKLFKELEIQAEYFTEKRTNILQIRADIPTLMGLQATPRANLGEAKGRGIDVSVDYQKSFSKDLWITVRGNFTYASSKYSVYEEPDYSNTTPWLSRVDQKISQKYGLIAERLFVDADDVLNSPRQQFGDYMAGDIKYKDINKDGIIDNRDKVPIGYPTTPEIIYGFGFSAGYKGFDFSCFFQGSARSSFWIDALAVTPFRNSLSGSKGNNAVLQFIEEDHWSEANQNVYAVWPRLASYHVANNGQGKGSDNNSDLLNTWFMRNGNFLRLKSAELGYTLPDHISHKLRLNSLRFYVSSTNLLCFSNFKLWDPEMGGDGLGYPVQRVVNIGLNLTF